MRRYGKGLNSFLYRPTPKRTNEKPKFAENDPSRYIVSGHVAGSILVIDQNTGKPVAGQLDSREEAQAWITERLGQ